MCFWWMSVCSTIDSRLRVFAGTDYILKERKFKSSSLKKKKAKSQLPLKDNREKGTCYC